MSKKWYILKKPPRYQYINIGPTQLEPTKITQNSHHHTNLETLNSNFRHRKTPNTIKNPEKIDNP